MARDTLKGPDSGRSWTFEGLLDLSDDGFRYEIINGSLLVTPPPGIGHQRIVTELVVALSGAPIRTAGDRGGVPIEQKHRCCSQARCLLRHGLAALLDRDAEGEPHRLRVARGSYA